MRSPCAAALRPPPPHTHTARARTPQPHTLTVTRPAGGAAPARPRWPPRPCSGHTFPACPGGTRRPSMKPQADLCGPLPTPPRRQRQVRVHNCQARPQPPPSGFPEPRDYRSCGGSVSARRPRPGGGAGQVTRASLQLGLTAGEAPRLRCHGSHQLEFWHRPVLQFLNTVSLQRTLAPGWATSWPGCGHCI